MSITNTQKGTNMAMKPNPFTGKETKKNEAAELKTGKKAYIKGEKAEGEKNPKWPAKGKK